MHKCWAMVLTIFLGCSSLSWADRISLGTPINIPNQVATGFETERPDFDDDTKVLTVRYRPVTSNGTPIMTRDADAGGWKTWICRDEAWDITNAACTDANQPRLCCTGAGTGTCNTLKDDCFSDVLGAILVTGDAGITVGRKLRDLIRFEMCKPLSGGRGILPGANTCTLP